MKQKIQDLLNKLPYEIRIRFALHCYNDIKNLITHKRSLKALLLVEKWLHNPNSVTSQELYNAVHIAYPAFSYAASVSSAYAANSAYYAASAAASATANTTSSVVSNAASNAASAAASAAAHTTAYTSRNYEKKLKQYYNDLKILVKDLTDLERVFLDLN